MHSRLALSLAFLLSSSGAVARAHAATWPEACGPEKAGFKVSTEKTPFAAATASPEKARVVFIQALGDGVPSGSTTRFGGDGAWLGAAKGSSYFAIDLAPGRHNLCASRQSSAKIDKDNTKTASVNLEASKTYFYEYKITRAAGGSPEMRVSPTGVPGSSMTAREPDPVDSADLNSLEQDAALTRIAKLPQSKATAK